MILGPCRCKGCHELVVLVREGLRLRWLHGSGLMRCPNRKPYTPQRAYWRVMKQAKRAAA